MFEIRPVDTSRDLPALLKVIQDSFMTVANDFHITKVNAPSNGAFMKMEDLIHSIEQKTDYFCAFEDKTLCGCTAVQPGKEENTFYIEKLAVLPSFRHKKYGKKLLDRAVDEIKKRNGTYVSIGIINENTTLKNWYISYGFIEKETKKFNHLPFTVCFLGISLNQNISI